MSNKNFPGDVVTDILARLPIKSLLRFRCVCKPWCSTINDTKFIHMHLNIRRTAASIEGYVIYKPLDTGSYCKHIFSRCDGNFAERETVQLPLKCASGKPFNVVGSCNGLLCLTDSVYPNFGCTIYVWNPFIGKFKAINNSCVPRLLFNRDCSNVVLGFGFDAQNIDYKVVRVLNFTDLPLPDVEVYNLSTDSWRRIEADVPCVTWTKPLSSTFFNGASHWIVFRDGYGRFIASFDFHNEVFGEIMLPNRFKENDQELTLGVFKDSLGMIVFPDEREQFALRFVWVMKEYGISDSWVNLFTIGPLEKIGRPLGFGWDNEVLFRDYEEKLFSYCHDTRGSRHIGMRSILDAFTYVESLVLVNEGHNVSEQAKPFSGVTYKGVSIFLNKEEEEEECCELWSNKQNELHELRSFFY
ncbi:hypothetical protein L1049_000690 [Liquidambar formosana]|uniref:F-box domain-containing protein n=1 Tax=Liquidambar formosana TaxID=63359 RepID=A0AAP0NBX1_LIQFO